MSPFSMVVWIVGICVIGSIIKKTLERKVPLVDQASDDSIEKLVAINEQLNSKVKELEQRIISLEAIVTDEGYQLKQKITGL